MPHLTIDEHTIYFNDSGDGMPVVLLHNGFYSTKTWDSVRETIAQGFRVVDYDRYGYGQSTHFEGEPLIGDIVEYGVNELTALVDALELKQFHLVGHCLGGAIALLYAVRHPNRVAKVVAESVGYYGNLKSLIKTDMTFVPFERIEKALMRKMSAMHGKEYAKLFWKLLSDHRNSYIMSEDYDIRKEVKKLKAPVFLINGDRDFYFDVDHPFEIYKKLRKNAFLWIAHDCGHDVHHEIPLRFSENVMEFLAKDVKPTDSVS